MAIIYVFVFSWLKCMFIREETAVRRKSLLGDMMYYSVLFFHLLNV